MPPAPQEKGPSDHKPRGKPDEVPAAAGQGVDQRREQCAGQGDKAANALLAPGKHKTQEHRTQREDEQDIDRTQADCPVDCPASSARLLPLTADLLPARAEYAAGTIGNQRRVRLPQQREVVIGRNQQAQAQIVG